MLPAPQVMALSSALCSAVASVLIQRGLRGSNFFAGFWINIAVGMIGLWSATLLLVPYDQYSWRAVPYFVFSGIVGTTGGRFFRVVSIQKVGASVASAIGNLAPFISTGLAIVVLGEHVTLRIFVGTTVIVAGTILLSLSGKHAGFEARHLMYPFLAASCFGVVAIARKLGLSHAGPLFGAAMNITAAMIASSAFVLASGNGGALRCDRRSLLYFIGGGITENAGVFLVILALGLGHVSVVIPLAGTAPLFVLLLAYFFPIAAEKLTWRVVAGSALIVLGVGFLTR